MIYPRLIAYIVPLIFGIYGPLQSFFPRVSIITSLYKGDLFIEQFLEDIVQQTIFDQCELIIINANSPGNEEEIILQYVEHYPNILYVRLRADPGLYAVWNLALKFAKGTYITNANVDDRLAHTCYAMHAAALDAHPEIDLVYSDKYDSYIPNETFAMIDTKNAFSYTMSEFSIVNMHMCLPSNHPMWRKTMHTKYGFFNEAYRSAGDYEMWVRAVAQGSVFMKVPFITGVYYVNPEGLSTRADSPTITETQEIKEKYAYLGINI